MLMSVMRVIAFGRSCSYIHYVKLLSPENLGSKMSQFNLFWEKNPSLYVCHFQTHSWFNKTKKLFHDTKQIKLITNYVFLSYIRKFFDLLLHVVMTAQQYGCSKMTSMWSGKKKTAVCLSTPLKVQKKASLDRISINLSIKTKSSTAVSFVFLNHVSTVTIGLLNFPLNWQTSDILCGVWKIWHDLVTNRR